MHFGSLWVGVEFVVQQRATSNKSSKIAFREKARQRRETWVRSLTPEARKSIDLKLSEQTLVLVRQLGGQHWACYRGRADEANLDPLFNLSGSSDLMWCFPRAHNEELEFLAPRKEFLSQPNGWASCFSVGRFGLQEPLREKCDVIPRDRLDGILIPCLAADLLGNRMGWGKGFYDRALSGYRGHRVAVAYSVQIENENFPKDVCDVWDERVAFVVTEDKTFSCAA